MTAIHANDIVQLRGIRRANTGINGWPRSAAWLAALLLLVPARELIPQNVTVRGGPTCAQCRLQLDTIVRLGSIDDPLLLATSSHFAFLPDGRILAAPTSLPGQLAIFDGSGRQTGAFGVRGQGPTEFEQMRDVQTYGDSIFVLDGRQRRISVLDSRPSFSRATTSQARISSGQLLVFETGFVALGAPAALILDRGGGVRHAVNPTSGATGTSSHGVPVRVAKAGPAEFWLAPSTMYRAELWDLEGRQRRVIEGSFPWFEAHTLTQRPMNAPFRERPWAGIRGLHQDGDGRLWILFGVADSRWRPLATGAPSPGEYAYADYYDTLLHVLDLRTGVLLYEHRFPGIVDAAGGDAGYFGELSYTTEGVPIWTVVRPRLIGQ